MYFNYKGALSIVLLAAGYANNCFAVLDVALYGRSGY